MSLPPPTDDLNAADDADGAEADLARDEPAVEDSTALDEALTLTAHPNVRVLEDVDQL